MRRTMNPILKLQDLGQSCWLDNLTRAKITSGELNERIAKEGIRGVTSNPSIFSKAISMSNDYDGQIKSLAEEDKSIQEIYEAVVVKDIQDACDILRPVYDGSEAADGFVSLEVSPYLAHDTEGTLREARRLFKAVGRPNCLIKIPGTPAGISAVEESLYEGVNVNITLLFSIASYEAVTHAYIRALERRVAEGKPVDDIASVASFFLSRIDLLVDQLLGHLIIPGREGIGRPKPEQLFGKAAIASAKLAYQSFKRIFSGDRWRSLELKGARVQRPLWASTSTKDPLYSDTCYVAPLIGPNTVNTMPEETIAAFADHGTAEAGTIEKDIDEAQRIFRDLEKVGVDLDSVTRQLVNEGIQKFIEPFDKLMTVLTEKRQRFLSERMTRCAIVFGDSKPAVTAALGSLGAKQFTRRLYNGDSSLWTSEPDEAAAIRNRLGWLTSVEQFLGRIDELNQFAEEIRQAQISHVVLPGMGGSSLCAEVCRDTFGSSPGWPQLLVLDNTDPAAVRRIKSEIDFSRTLFVIASKSGTTKETLSFYRYFYDQVKRKNPGTPGEHFVAITDRDTPLASEARNKHFRRIFENPADIGGRYSALSYFGLVPMALIGIDIRAILQSAHQMQLGCGSDIPADVNPAVSLGTLLGINQRNGRDKVTFVLSKSVKAFGVWVEQLLAESTGKSGLGLIPVEGEALGNPESYDRDRLFVLLYTPEDDIRKALRTLAALEKNGHPVVRIAIQNRLALGGELLRWEIATAIAGAVMGVNPFDEPNVAESKNNTRDLLEEWKRAGSFSVTEPILEEDGISIYCKQSAEWMFGGNRESVQEFLGAFLQLAVPSDYIALLPYFLATHARQKQLQRFRLLTRDRLKVATTLGYGPRYLHSTGQLHKGGPTSGVFLMLTADAGREVRIPGEDYGFATLQLAQALGDYRSLNDKNRRVIRIHLGRHIGRGLKRLVEMAD